MVHPIKVNFSDDTLFNKNHLDNIPIGDSVLFRFSGEFNLYNIILKYPCSIKNKVRKDILEPIYIFPIVTTDPVWLFTCPADDNYYYNRGTYFTLNAGYLREQYFSNTAATIVVIKIITLQ